MISFSPVGKMYGGKMSEMPIHAHQSVTLLSHFPFHPPTASHMSCVATVLC